MDATVGKYTLESELGRGATGVVFRARSALGELVAVKILDNALASDATFRTRFGSEVETMQQLDNPNCVAVYDHAISVGEAWFAMEYIDGAPLSVVLEQAGTLTAAQACGVLIGALTGLGHAHHLGLVHRDFKPANILVDRKGTSKLTDFGLVVDHTHEAPWRTVEGTPAYMSPEQIRGDALDVRSDIYAAGCVLRELITGEPPYSGNDPLAVMNAHVSAPLPNLGEIPDHIGAVVNWAMAKDANDRPDSAEAFAAALEGAAERDLGPLWLASATIAGLAAGVIATRTASARLDTRHGARNHSPLRARIARLSTSTKIIASTAAVAVLGAVGVVAANAHDSTRRVTTPAVNKPAATTATNVKAKFVVNTTGPSGSRNLLFRSITPCPNGTIPMFNIQRPPGTFDGGFTLAPPVHDKRVVLSGPGSWQDSNGSWAANMGNVTTWGPAGRVAFIAWCSGRNRTDSRGRAVGTAPDLLDYEPVIMVLPAR